MARPFSVRSDSADPTLAEDQFGCSATVNSAARLRRWAELVASGEAPLPEDLAPEELRTVLREVGRLRRERLVRLIARAVAQDLQQNPER